MVSIVKSGDGYNTMLIGHDISAPGNGSSNLDFTKLYSTEIEGQIIALFYPQIGSSILFYKLVVLYRLY